MLRVIRITCVGLGFTTLIFAAGLALWGWLVATKSMFEGMWDPFDRVHEYGWRHRFPVGPAVSVVCIAAVMLGVSAYAWSRRSRAADHGGRALATLGVLYLAGFSLGLPSFYRIVMHNYPVTPEVPLVVAAWLVALGGLMALLVALPLAELTRKAVPVVAVGAALGVVAAVVPAALAVHAGDDQRYLDATVAPSVETPAAPLALGQRRFSVKVSDWHGPSNQPDFQVIPGGAGFVVFYHGQVTGYGSDGKERWHYRRTGPGRVSIYGARVFDEGRTVVAAIQAGPTGEGRVLVGLDAVTGHELWSERPTWRTAELDAFHPFRSTHGLETREPSPFVIAGRPSGNSTWTRIDTRTGKPLWTVDSPVGHDCFGRAADTQTSIATAIGCFANGTVKFGVVVQDPASGQKLWQTTFSTDIPDKRDNRLDLQVTQAGRDGMEVEVAVVGARAPTIRTYVNVVSHEVLDLGPQDRVEASPQRGDVFLVATSHQPAGSDLSLFGMDGLRRCTLTPGLELSRDLMGDYKLYLPLTNGVVVYDRKSHQFQTFDDYTCALRTGQQASQSVDWLGAAPGAILVQRVETNGAYIDGYA